VLKLVPVPLAGDPPVAVHENVYGVVPPVADAVHVTAVLTVPEAGQVIVATRASGLIVIVADTVEVAALASVAVTEMVLLPLVE
jgi:precorrin-4 methylase